MQGEIILTGTELITGQVAEVNARYAARRLHESGLVVQCITTLGDGAPLFGELLQRALGRSRFIIVTGGLGPTDDDLTVAQAAAALHLKLVQDEGMVGRLKRRLEDRGFAWEPGCGKMALIPVGATVLDTGRAACGFSLKHQDVWLFFCPASPGRCTGCSSPACCRSSWAWLTSLYRWCSAISGFSARWRSRSSRR